MGDLSPNVLLNTKIDKCVYFNFGNFARDNYDSIMEVAAGFVMTENKKFHNIIIIYL